MNELSNVPFYLTVLAEWCACITAVLYMEKRFRRTVTIFYSGIGLVVHYYVMNVAYRLERLLGGSWYIRMIPLVIYMILFLRLLLQVSWKNIFFIWCKAFLTAEVMASAAWRLYCSYVLYKGEESYPAMTAVVCLVYGAVMCITYVLEKTDAEYFNTKETDYRQNMIAVLVTILMFYLSNRNIPSGTGLAIDEALYGFDTRVVFDIFGYMILYLLQKMFVEYDMSTEISAIKNTLNAQYAQYVNFREASEFISRQCHDMKHQIIALKSQSMETEREEYIRQLEETIQDYDTGISTGNSVLDTILTQKNYFCRKNGIELNCRIDGRELEYLSVRDICSIFGNILDNAIEAVMKYEQPEKRVIHGEVYKRQSFIIIRFENYFDDDLIVKNSVPVTTKSDKARHGYGIKSIRYTAEKYHGNVSIKKENNWFVINIIIPEAENTVEKNAD